MVHPHVNRERHRCLERGGSDLAVGRREAEQLCPACEKLRRTAFVRHDVRAFVAVNAAVIATLRDGITTDTITTHRNAFSIFMHGQIYKSAFGFFARFDDYSWYADNNNKIFES